MLYDYSHDDSLEFSVTDLPITLYGNLKMYQKKGIEYAINHYGRWLIGDEMGVGKTLQGLCIAKVYQKYNSFCSLFK